jgi:ATP-dependent helicase HrpB
MVGGRGVVLSAESVVREAELFVAVDVESGAGPGAAAAPEARVRAASAVRREWLGELFPGALASDTAVVFDPERERVVARTRSRYHDLVLEERVSTDVDAAEAGKALAAAARAEPGRAFRLGAAERTLVERVAFCRRWLPDLGFPEITARLPDDLVESLCAGRRSFAETRDLDVAAALARRLGREQRVALERHAPADLMLPNGRRVPVTYEADKPPSVAARIQEVFGLRATPRLGGGRVPLVIALLAPNGRPVQITDDLESFWRTTYAGVRRQLRGRYPKHQWPEDPLAAAPTSSMRPPQR